MSAGGPEFTGRDERYALAALAVLPLLLFGGALLPGRILSPAGFLSAYAPWKAVMEGAVNTNPVLADVALQFHPWLIQTVGALWEGRLPLWNPHAYGGAPLLGNMQSGVFSPFNLPAYVLPLGFAIGLGTILKLQVAGLGMYRFLRVLEVAPVASLLGGAAFMLNGFLVVWLQHPHGAVGVWLPVLFLAVTRLVDAGGPAAVATTALVVSACHFGGHPETTIHALAAAGAWGLYRARRPRRAAASLLAAGALGTLIASVQWLPFLEYLGETNVWEARKEGMAAAPMAWRYLPSLFAPLTAEDPQVFHETSASVGPIPWLLAPLAVALAWRRHGTVFFAGLACVCALAVFDAPAVPELVSLVPGFAQTSTHRLLLVLAFAASALGAVGLHALLAGPGRPGSAVLAVPLAGALIAFAVGRHRWSVDAVAYVTFSDDGRRLAVAHFDGTARVLDAGTGEEVRFLAAHAAGVLSADFTPSGRWLATGSLDGTARLNPLYGDGPARTYRCGSTAAVWSVAVSPDQRRLATGSADGAVRLWNLKTAALELEIAAQEGAVIAVAFSPRGESVYSAGDDGAVSRWNAASGRRERVYPGHAGRVTAVSLSRDGSRMATAAGDGTVGLWDASAAEPLWFARVEDGPAYSTAVSPDGTTVIAAGKSGVVHAWDAVTGELTGSLKGHRGEVWCVAFAGDGRRAASGDARSRVVVWDVDRGASVVRTTIGPPWHRHAPTVLVVALTIGGLLAGTVLILALARRPRARALAGALLVVEAAGLAALPLMYHHTIPSALFYPRTPALRFLLAQPGIFRADLCLPNVAGAYGLDGVNGYDGLGPRRIDELLRDRPQEGVHGNAPLEIPDRGSPVVNLLNLRFVVLDPRSPPPAARYRTVYDGPDARVFENPEALPRAFVAGRAVFRPPAETAALVRSGAVDFGTTVVLEGDGPPRGTARIDASVAWRRREPERQELKVSSDHGGWLVVTDLLLPGWRAELDGEPARLLRANHAFRAVRIPAGEHVVVMAYRSRALAAGLLGSLGGALLAGWLLVRSRLRRRIRPTWS